MAFKINVLSRSRGSFRKIPVALLLFTFGAIANSQAQQPADVQQYIDKGMAELNSGRHKEALSIFDRCLAEIKPGPWDCSFRRGILLLAFPDRRREAASELEKVTAERPNDIAASYALGRAYALLSRTPESIRAFTRCIELDPSFRNAWVSRANLQFEIGKLDDAIADITAAIKLDPNDPRAYDLRGTFHMYRLDHAKALPDLTRAIQLDPKFVMPLVTRGNSFALQQKYDLALIDLDRAIELDPASDIAYKSRAAVYCNIGKKALANVDEAKVIELGGKVEQPCKF